MRLYQELAQSVTYKKRGMKIAILNQDENLTFVGAGRSACVFRVGKTDKVLKVYYPSFVHIANEEAEIYRLLEGLEYFPKLYETGTNYIVIDYIAGVTLFECLIKGIHIKEEKITGIDYALSQARQRGLNPSDIHLKNIFITFSGKIKIIDVARFRQTKQCKQWEDLKMAHSFLYKHGWFPKKLPQKLLNLIAMIYKKRFIPSFKRERKSVFKVGNAKEVQR
ncbi:serine/threonine protein kinase [Bacillus sp. FJAT-18017]|uniref:serine/threonine protein kinase n=1 Tax=Bacillus sp. FJAT-18017 TaxID=1705566 RepID=UPI0006AFFED2|nr:serine/threonine protein kinase [Bacillus sp. FJAT-18017]ALC92462.1 serine/threonine protein kinase [Bacillus sp. FJAT-18017]